MNFRPCSPDRRAEFQTPIGTNKERKDVIKKFSEHWPNRMDLTHRLLLDGGQEGRRSSREMNIDINMVIILAALLCGLICAIVLNSILRCALRFCHGISSEPSNQQAGNRLPTKVPREDMLRQIPVAMYGSGVKIMVGSCTICLSEFIDGELVKVWPKCHHGFHVRCIDMWLVSHLSCPICRRPLLDSPVTPTEAYVEV